MEHCLKERDGTEFPRAEEIAPAVIQQLSMNVNGCRIFCTEEFNSSPSLHTHFHIKHHCQTAPLLPAVTQQQNVTGHW